MPNPCEELKSSEITAKEIDIDGTKYYYSKGNEKNQFHIFRFDSKIQGYLPLQTHEYHYADIMRKLLKL